MAPSCLCIPITSTRKLSPVFVTLGLFIQSSLLRHVQGFTGALGLGAGVLGGEQY